MMERAGRLLFRWRSFTPVLLILVAVPLLWRGRGPASRLWLALGLSPGAAQGAQPRGGLGRARAPSDRFGSPACAALALRHRPGRRGGSLAGGEGLEAPLAARQLHRGLPPPPARNGALASLRA